MTDARKAATDRLMAKDHHEILSHWTNDDPFWSGCVANCMLADPTDPQECMRVIAEQQESFRISMEPRIDKHVADEQVLRAFGEVDVEDVPRWRPRFPVLGRAA